MARPQICLIAAVARNGVIGRDNGLVWHDPVDAKHFRATTMGCPVIMGRKTWDSLPAKFRPLPGRRNLVVSRSATALPGAEVFDSLEAALAACTEPEVCVIGGAEIYALALPQADKLALTEVDAVFPEADRHFPAWPRERFSEVGRGTHTSADGLRFDFVDYLRKD